MTTNQSLERISPHQVGHNNSMVNINSKPNKSSKAFKKGLSNFESTPNKTNSVGYNINSNA